LRRTLLVLLAASIALPAQARARKKKPRAPVIRAEDDPRKRARAFPKASVAFAAPADLSQSGDGAVPVRLVVKGYAIGALQPGGVVPHAHLIVDSEPAMEITDAKATWMLGGLAPGPHVLRVVLCRPWHEVVKAPKAFAMVRFWMGPRIPGKAGRAAESVTWPQPGKPILTYVLPVGEPSDRLVLARLEEPAVAAATPVIADAGQVAPEPAQSTPGTEQVKPPDPVATPIPGGNRPVLDFYLSNAKLGRRGDKIRIVLDRRELPLITDWNAHPLRRARGGAHRISIDLLSRRGVKVNNVLNRTDRVFTVEALHRETGKTRGGDSRLSR
jgi:hypothetical protein